MTRIDTVLQLLKLVGGLLLFIAPFTSRFRRESPVWTYIALPLAGALIEVHVGLAHFLNGLRLAHDPRYWLLFPKRTLVGGIVIGILLSFLLQLVCDRVTKARKLEQEDHRSS